MRKSLEELENENESLKKELKKSVPSEELFHQKRHYTILLDRLTNENLELRRQLTNELAIESAKLDEEIIEKMRRTSLTRRRELEDYHNALSYIVKNRSADTKLPSVHSSKFRNSRMNAKPRNKKNSFSKFNHKSRSSSDNSPKAVLFDESPIESSRKPSKAFKKSSSILPALPKNNGSMYAGLTPSTSAQSSRLSTQSSPHQINASSSPITMKNSPRAHQEIDQQKPSTSKEEPINSPIIASRKSSLDSFFSGPEIHSNIKDSSIFDDLSASKASDMMPKDENKDLRTLVKTTVAFLMRQEMFNVRRDHHYSID